jgi:hypothetical protein
MSEDCARNPLQTIRSTLQSIELRLHRADISPDGLADLKSAIDDARLRVWAALSAGRAADAEAVLLRFRLRRATEICSNVLRDLHTETLGQHQRELIELRDVTQLLAERISNLVRGEEAGGD